MKVITIKQPWATLIVEGYKRFELEVGKQIIEGIYLFMLEKE